MRDDPDFMERISRDLAARKAACRILDVEEDADEAQLKKAYRIAAVQHHPDRNGNTVEANRTFILVRCAYELLALDKPCAEILEEINSWPGVPEDSKYRMDNPWGQFLWWREKFFDSGSNDKKQSSRGNSCI